MQSVTASMHGTNNRHDFHQQIHHEWIIQPYIRLYYGPTQPEQSHGTPQKTSEKIPHLSTLT